MIEISLCIVGLELYVRLIKFYYGCSKTTVEPLSLNVESDPIGLRDGKAKRLRLQEKCKDAEYKGIGRYLVERERWVTSEESFIDV